MNAQDQYERKLEEMDSTFRQIERLSKVYRITLKDTNLLSQLPVGRWFAAGAYNIHGAKLARLHRLGLLQRKAPSDSKLARTWDYYRRR